MRVSVDRRSCIGAGMCVLAASEVFEQADDGRSVVLDTDPPPELHVRVREAEQECPAAAIRLAESA
ncbi:ferredoxin [Nocardia carnea]|uniref:Ferredoxin n=1 Tax=Nocardia carnea TaxID=37328 RepID=A0ABW7TFF1_9NOCA|nr:ferredoxin [Nocardia carnea]